MAAKRTGGKKDSGKKGAGKRGGRTAPDGGNAGNGAHDRAMTVSVFGMSTEGYDIARQAAIDGATVFIIDESNPTAIELNAEIARTYPHISALQDDEPIMSLEPLHVAVSRSDYLFFAPRIRAQLHSTKASTHSLFKDAVEHVKEGASVVFCVPVGIGESSEYVSILQHDTGLEVGSEVSYYYYPLESGRPPPRMVGSVDPGRVDGRLAAIFSPDPENPAEFATLAASEYIHAMEIVSRFASICTMLEVAQFVPRESVPEMAVDDRMQESYLDGMVGGLLDMRAVGLSLEDAKSLQRLPTLYAKGLDSYVRRLVDNTKQIIRDCDMRTTKTKVVILWSFDDHLMRGDRNEICNVLASRLHDWLADVDVYAEPPPGIFSTDKPMAVIPCSLKDFELAAAAKAEKPNLVVVKATPLCEQFEGS